MDQKDFKKKVTTLHEIACSLIFIGTQITKRHIKWRPIFFNTFLFFFKNVTLNRVLECYLRPFFWIMHLEHFVLKLCHMGPFLDRI